MANIFSKSGSYFGTASWSDPNTWIGGIVPTASDNVFIFGLRSNIYGTGVTNFDPNRWNPGPIQYWPGTMSVMLGPAPEYSISGSDFTAWPDSGSFYTYTDRNAEVKIDYNGKAKNNPSQPNLVNALTNLVIDKTYGPWGQVSASLYNSNSDLTFPDPRGGVIPYAAQIFFRPGVISISGSLTGSAFQTTIQDGGHLKVEGLGAIRVGNFVDVQHGTLELRDYASFVWNSTYPYSSSVTATSQPISASYLNFSNRNYSKVIFEGEEVRSNTLLGLPAEKGNFYLSVTDSSKFEAGDWIFVGDETIPVSREDDNTFNQLYNQYYTQAYSFNIPSDDECLYVVGKDTGSIPNRLYVKLMNGLESKILLTASATELVMDEDRYQVGDKVLVGTQYRTITAVEDYDLLLKDYDFTNPSTTLADWETDVTRAPWFDSWGIIPGVGLTNTYGPTSSFNSGIENARQTFIKNLMLTRVKVDAWMRAGDPISGSGLSTPAFQNPNSYGVITHQDPTMDYNVFRVNSDGYGSHQLRNMLSVSPSGSTVQFLVKSGGSSGGQKPIIAGIKDLPNLHKYTIETFKGYTKGYIDDIKMFEEVAKNGYFWGRVGLASNNPRFVCTRFRVYNKCQKITLNSAVTASAGQTIYESGIEYPHSMGAKVIKLASYVNEVPDNLKNKAFAYQGAEEYENNGAFPYVYTMNQVAGNKTGANNNVSNIWCGGFGAPINDMAGGTNLPLNLQSYSTGRVYSGSFVIDLTQTMSFNNFGIIDLLVSNGQSATASIGGGISLSGSNDPSTQIWTPITGGILDPRGRHNYQTIREWDLGSVQNYRFVRFQVDHWTYAPNYNSSIAAFVLRSGSAFNQITLNNTSDLNVGDKIGIYPNRTGLRPTNVDFTVDQFVKSGSGAMLDGTTDDFYTIVAKTGNTLTVDRKINLIIKKGTCVVKLNRNINFVGSYASGSGIRTGRIWGDHGGPNGPFNGFTAASRVVFKNVGFQHISDAYPYLANSAYGSIAFNYQNIWTPLIIQGCSFYNNLPGGAGAWQGGNNGGKVNVQVRHNILHGFYPAGTLKPYSYEGQNGPGFLSAPYILTGNIFIATSGQNAANDNHSMTISSYNQYWYQDDIAGPVYNQVQKQQGRYLGGMLRVERNTYIQAFTPFSMGAYGQWQITSPTSNVGGYIFKNNKIQSIGIPSPGAAPYNYILGFYNNTFPAIGQNTDYVTGVMENVLLADRGGFDGALPTSFNAAQGITYAPAYNNTRAVATFPMKNFNKWGFDTWTTNVGWVVKHPEDSFYKFYNFSSSLYYGPNVHLYKLPFMDAQVAIYDDTTSSFTLGFDYYHDMTQYINQNGAFIIDENNGFIQYDAIHETGGLAPYTFSQSIFIPTSQSLAGSLAVSVYKNGKLLKPTTKIRKTLTPTNYTETFLLEGKGIYSIYLGQDFSPQGYVALRNITSTVNCPLTSSIDVRHNGFNMSYFNGMNSYQLRNFNNQNPNVGGKFRLKGARMF